MARNAIRIGAVAAMVRSALLIGCAYPLMIASPSAGAATIDLTRYVAHFARGTGHSMATAFFAVPGSARLMVDGASPAAPVTIQLNDQTLLLTDSSAARVVLLEDNTIAVAASGTSDSPVSVRVKQQADVQLQVKLRMHFNTNVSDFKASREFYRELGFETLSGFPDTNTQAMARAIGVSTPTPYDGSAGDEAGGYLLHGELIGLAGFRGGLIDLIEFSIPKNDEPPYPRLNHLGMARAAMYTTNIGADHAHLEQKGVNFLSAPVARSDGSRFAIFTDPDGTFYELIESPGGSDGAEPLDRPTHIDRLGAVTINVSDFERSRAWYQMLGYELTQRLPGTESIEVARAMGFDEPFRIDGGILTHPADGSTIELVQWISPYDPEPAYPLPVNHLGIGRIALATDDIAADVASLKAQGVQFVSEITPCCSGPDSWGSIVAFHDPDGAIVELVEQPFLTTFYRIMSWLRDLF
ncbi:MAG TPA: VOC family protein [Pseudomonadales bacterium]